MFARIYGLIALLMLGMGSITGSSVRLVSSVYNQKNLMPVIKNGCFFNHEHEWRFQHICDAVRTFVATCLTKKSYHTTDVSQWIQHDIPVERSVDLRVQWIGHASFLMQLNNVNILTDPVFYDIHTILCRRKMPVGIKPEQLPPIDCVMISHNHRDHTDEASLRFLISHQPIMLVPEGTKTYFTSLGFVQVYEHQWWQESIVRNADGNEVRFTFVPADHWSGRSLLDAYTSLWGGWIIQANQKTVYFAGDTAFNEAIFKEIADYAGSIDCAILPIGPCEPRETECSSHMDSTEAVTAFTMLQARMFIPMHWGTFAIGHDSFTTPIRLLDAAWQNSPTVHDKKLYKIKFGESILI